ncbi:MAG: hypothetical protein WB626_11720, partial [Bacteroidota bacterium]
MGGEAGGRIPGPERTVARPWRGDAPPRRVLLIRLHALGDTAITLPYLAGLRRRFPAATVDYLTTRDPASLVEALEGTGRVVVFGP